jgi:type VI secretion system secreted protein VgrG
MATYTQANRVFAVSTPLGADKLLLTGFAGEEGLSRLFSFRLDLLAELKTEVPFDKLLGQPVSLRLNLPGDKKRFFHGICVGVGQGESDFTFTQYHMEIVPSLWLLGRRVQSRIFQHKSVPDILKEVLKGFDVTYEIQGTFHPREYCVQYRESDLDFASRLMEEEGIYYYFAHTEQSHKMIVANTPQSHRDLPGGKEVTYKSITYEGELTGDSVHEWGKTQGLTPGKYTLWDHHFQLPDKHLETERPVTDGVSAGGHAHTLKVGDNGKLEIYDYPGRYALRFDGIDKGGGEQPAELQKIFEENKRVAEIRMQAGAVAALAVRGSGSCRRLVAGHKFTVVTPPGDLPAKSVKPEGAYVLTRVKHSAKGGSEFQSGGAGPFEYRAEFECIPAALPFRPPRTTPRPTVPGTQTAVVVGPSGEEIFTDKYGRVKVQFRWDREGKNDADSSCWARVGSIWAGKQWGAVHIPRIGQEVIVDFLEGDPDQPIIIGSVYNADQMPPYKLPDNKTQSGLKSRSTLKGTPENFNELRFEDKKGSEEVYFHAEKDFNRVVENNDTLKVGFDKKDKGDQTVEIFNNQQLTVGAGKAQAADGSQTVEVFNSQKVTVGSGKFQASDGSQTLSVFKDRTATIEMGNDSLTIKMGDQTTKLNLGKSETEALQSIELKVGQSSVKLDQMGVTIKGMMISIEGQIQTEVKGLMVQVTADALLQEKGAITMIG